jgi:hypothetical protein
MHLSFHKIRYNSWFFGILLSALLGLASSCTQSTPEKSTRALMLESVDSLWNDLRLVRVQFKFKMDEFVDRKTDMEKQLIKAQFLKDSDLTEDDKTNFDKYNGVYRVYKSLGSKYKTAVLTAEDLFYSIKGLEKEVKNGTYESNIEGFKKERDLLKVRLAENLRITLEVTEKLTALEPLYLRTSEKVDALVEAKLPEKP